MSRFYVGQRVRIRYLRTRYWAHLAGAEGQIVAVGDFDAGGNWREPGNYRVSVPSVDRIGQFIGDQLEPIQPEGAAPSEFTTLHDLLRSLERVTA